ncbi:hypothetical protein CTheo_6817 [Ceratobasidium theobromae]|uniref:pectin lyase n=1 Tax=Ceratobasidium theobromae TaxID=1582974 RepID=A0A5N5QDZ7_9AGAM|nr:hypothetical protein CTheo_6817 [Ceratobasidium theobromae]
MSILLKSILASLVASQGALAIGTPFGYGAGATGGGSATAAVPSSTAELISWLGDSTARVILLDKTFDFTSTEGTTTGAGCIPYTCTPGAQIAIDLNTWCEREQPNAETTTVTYNTAGISGISVGSNKTLLGKGTAGWIKGKGLRIAGSSNIIIQNVRFSDINAAYIDHNYFKDVGRQFLVTGYGAAEGVTISDNIFDGSGSMAPVCTIIKLLPLQGRFVTDIITGPCTLPVKQTPLRLHATTFIRHRVADLNLVGFHRTLVSTFVTIHGSTNSPETEETVHIYNNYFVDITDHALDAGPGSKAIVEGNYFNTVVRPSTDGNTGQVFAPTDSTMSAQCTSSLGRSCVTNTLLSSGELANADDSSIIGSFTNSAVTGVTVMTASEAATYVQANAGTGIIN